MRSSSSPTRTGSRSTMPREKLDFQSRREATAAPRPRRSHRGSERAGMALDPSLLLFVPADRPERFGKALASGASGAILDLEDAVTPDRKAFAREQVRAFADAHDDLTRVAVRINPPQRADGHADVAMLARTRRMGAIVVPKAGDAG